MKQIIFILLLLAIYAGILSCRENSQINSTGNQGQPLTGAIEVKRDTLNLNSMDQEVPPRNYKMEDSLLKAVALLPTVMLRDAYMLEKTGGKRYLKYHIDHRPTIDSPYYIIRAVEDNGGTYVTHFHFYYFIKDRQFKLYDTINDSLVSLDPEDEDRWELKNRSCRYIRKFSVEQRMAKYPFSAARKVRLISFRAHLRRYPFIEGQVLEDSVIESKELSTNETEQLTDIIYNNFFYGKMKYGTAAQCFHPRHAIVFYNSAGVVEAYVLVCFHCKNYRPSSDSISFGDECSDKTEKIRKFFIQKGIRFGTDINQDHFPGEDDERVLPAGLDPGS
jgi:hypothetical protein